MLLDDLPLLSLTLFLPLLGALCVVFIRGDETEESWRIITPVLHHWKECDARGLETYAAGSWGPLAAERLLWEHKHEWRRPGP